MKPGCPAIGKSRGIITLKFFADLEKIDFDGGFAFEERDENSNFTFFLVDGVDGADKISKRTGSDFDNFSDGERSLIFGFVLFDFFDNMINFFLGDGRGFVVDTDKTGNSGSSADGDPGIVGDGHLDNDITGEGFFLSFDFFTTTDDHFGLNRDNGLKNLIF
ncbi:MAG: hypothetical protein US90_C0018G0063 [Candidatus Shapirobacteria bacterium GW2011_GWE2_38_30]|uniref:Uncharacterized protein n=1 Tax=Candidatus Shapirobacteria bacterium GW2011_GWE2_38_30 TaxID=1618490 RepID=A0A0G0M6B2_9BACT|nr:MAG: hypothetical protein US90_C0018G0063 [Candidatus Shapirobacteria bacterium GW2011_GWE2_38_30]